MEPNTLFILAIVVGVVLFVSVLFLLKLFDKLLKWNPLLGLGFFYIVVLNIDGYFSRLFPNAWQVDQFKNVFSEVSLPHVLHFLIPVPRVELLSAVDISWGIVKLSIVIFFIYKMVSIGLIWKKKTPAKGRFSEDWSPSAEYQKEQTQKGNE